MTVSTGVLAPATRRRGRRLALVAAAVLGCGLSVSAVAQSTGFSLTGRVSERLDFLDDNTISNTGFGLTASTATRDSNFSLGAGFNLIAQTQSGNINLVNPNVSLSYGRQGKRGSFNSNARFTVQPIQYTDVDDNLNLVQRDGLRQTLSASAGVSYTLSRRTRANIGASLTNTDFSDAAPSLIPSQSEALTFGLNHTLTQAVSVGHQSAVQPFRVG